MVVYKYDFYVGMLMYLQQVLAYIRKSDRWKYILRKRVKLQEITLSES